jgi:branched-chain amino acid transport system substrate-binding protein
MQKRFLVVLLVLVLGVCALAVACGGDETTETTAGATGTTAAPATGEPIKLGYNDGFTSFMAYDVSLAEKGIYTALAMLDNQAAGRPLEYVKADNASDVSIAVDKARQLVESDGVDVMIGPIFSPATAAVTDYLAGSTGVPDISVMGQPSENLETANGLAFIPCGLYGSHGYYFGKYCAEVLGYKTANCIHYEDTAAYQLQAGFEKGFAEGGGTVTTPVYVPMDTVEFNKYLSNIKPPDCTLNWIFGAGAVPFVQQYKSYNLTAPLVVPMANNFSREQLAELGDLGVGMVACDIYVDTLDNPENQAFVAKYQELYPGEYPMPQGFGAALAIFMMAKAVETTGGDTTPAALIEAMSTMSLDTAAGKITMSPYKDAFIGTRDFFILETKKVDGVVQWAPVETIAQVLLDEKK